MQEWIVPVSLGALIALVLVMVVALVRTRSRTDRELAAARAESSSLRAQMDEIERRMRAPGSRDGEGAPASTDDTDRAGYLITRLGDDEEGPVPPAPGRIEGSLFADLLLRETVVKAAALFHGVRRGLAPEVRNRIRFGVRQEVKRARRARRAELRAARREGAARQRAALAGDRARAEAADEDAA